jgi:hypothetical protein
MLSESQPLDEDHELRIGAFVDHPACHLFNTPRFFRLHAAGKGHYFQLCGRRSGAAVATVHFTEASPGSYRSPARGTFGGFSASEDVTLEVLGRFQRAVEQALASRGARHSQIVLAPASHDLPLFSKSFNVLARSGYAVQSQDLSFDLAVNERPLLERMESGNRKRLNKCLRAGFVAERLAPARYAEAYQVIAANRRRRGFPMTMSYEQVAEMVEGFGERVRVFGVSRSAELIAAAISMAVTDAVLYVAYWGDVDGMQDHSPVVQLAACVYEHCQSSGISLLDAGTSTVAGEPNAGLIRFKRSLGFRESLKLTLAKGRAGA